ncbi:unnamed protein product [Chironomus riparius]|uniref:non-specific serine/threonine protein kinase n=1 Tax=Chironomus riparius TaxID=315576 RepID=A0A9N9RU98_9DIPT|nr:unnamed protein product [Chironomus riparius]
MITISEISYDENDILGHGSTATVFAGKFQSRDVAVKRVPKDKSKLIEREVDLLLKGDNHPNIVRYFMLAEDPDYQYIALERCQFTLLDYVKRGDLQTYLPHKELIWKIFQGMKRLHEIEIVHRDIKPSNILLLEMGQSVYEVKISDFGYSKDIGTSGSRMSVQPFGSAFYLPMEAKSGRFNAKSDVFMTGGLIYYIYKNGNPPPNFTFVWKFYFEEKSDDVLIKHLILNMTKENYEDRPSMNCLCYHPYFWDYQKILDFLINVSSRLEVKDALAYRVSQALQKNCEDVIQGSWMDVLEFNVRETLMYSSQVNYDGLHIENLLRTIRNKRNHYDEMTASAKKTLGSIPNGYTEFWIGKFPKLVLHVYLKSLDAGLSEEENFKQYFPDSNCN